MYKDIKIEMKENTYNYLIDRIKGKSALLCLIDPDKWQPSETVAIAHLYEESGADALLIGGSMMLNNSFSESIKEIKRH